MSDIFEEVDEEVRRDKALEFWNKHQNGLIALALIVVLATGGFRFWQYREQKAAEAAGAAFHAALQLDDQGKTDEAKAALARIQADAPAGYATLARFVEAAIAAKKDPKAGAAAYAALAGDASLDPLLVETARLRAALALLDAGETDAARSALTPLAAAGAYKQTARLTLASIALSAKDYSGAGKWLDQVVADPHAPQADRRTAAALLGLVAAQGVKPQP